MIKVLMVLDSDYRFNEPAAATDFTFTTLVSSLTAAGMSVTKAHRESDGTADISSFHFVNSVNLLDFDVLWLIGLHGRNEVNSTNSSGTNAISEPERLAIANFMAAGGGVFATGDHDSIGADMCGKILRVRAMRCWFGEGDGASPMPASFPRNFPVVGTGRADTVRKNPAGDYDLDNDGTDDGFIWFENQSDSVPQPITPTTSPAHPILRRNGADITVFPDHMHEGNTLGEVSTYDYTQVLPVNGQNFQEFPEVAGHRELPMVIATGQSVAQSSRRADGDTPVDTAVAIAKTVNTLSVYEGRTVGLGRIVTGSTFHHYIDINLTGATVINTAAEKALTGPDAAKGQGFATPGAEATFDAIKAVFVNTARWLARPAAGLGLILDRSTFSQDEVTQSSTFEGAILVTVDGLKPNQFPGGGITSGLTPAQLVPRAPALTVVGAPEILIEPRAVATDDPGFPDRLQRLTFTYRVRFTNAATSFGFAGETRDLRVDATLGTTALTAPLTASAFLQLIRAANPFMLDLANGNSTSWLSSDLRVFTVVAGQTRHGVTLPANATAAQARSALVAALGGMSVADFEAIPSGQSQSALSPFEHAADGTNVYNFAVARVRTNATAASASKVRVFFRVFTTQTTAALSYNEAAGEPVEGYKRTTGPDPIALPGVNAAGTEWLSFPFFAAGRAASPSAQADGGNVKDIAAAGAEISTFFGALLDNNLPGAYLPSTPTGGGAAKPLPDLLMSEHQCIVAQIEYAGAHIPDTSNPSTSDKLSQRNLAFSEVANPGLDASRQALHTFELERSPPLLADGRLPDELLLEWPTGTLEGTTVRLFVPGIRAADILDLADRLYPRHSLRQVDEHTVELPGGGTRFLPLPGSQARLPGLLTVEHPLGVRKGQRFDVSVRQVSRRARVVEVRPKVDTLSREEARRLVAELKPKARKAVKGTGSAVSLGDGRTLLLDPSVLDGAGDVAFLITAPDPKQVREAARGTATWRQCIGAFQLGMPVSTKEAMLVHHLRLLSVLRWRAQSVRPGSRWYEVFRRYVEATADKVRALGGDPWAVPATSNGLIPLPGARADDPRDPGTPPERPGRGDTAAACEEAPARTRLTGKISGLQFDHFGDFEGFTLEDRAGDQHWCRSREGAVRELARGAWAGRQVVTVTLGAEQRVLHLWLGGSAG